VPARRRRLVRQETFDALSENLGSVGISHGDHEVHDDDVVGEEFKDNNDDDDGEDDDEDDGEDDNENKESDEELDPKEEVRRLRGDVKYLKRKIDELVGVISRQKQGSSVTTRKKGRTLRSEGLQDEDDGELGSLTPVGTGTPQPRPTEMDKELLRLIPRYDGTGGVQKFREFVDNFESYARSTTGSAKDALIIAQAKLLGDAKLWLLDQLERYPVGHPLHIGTWEMLRKGLKLNFVLVETEDEIREKIRTLRQKGTIAEYNSAFRRLLMQVPMEFKEARYDYLRGLSPKIRDLVRTKDGITEMNELYQACLKLDDRIKTSNVGASRTTTNEALVASSPSHRQGSTSRMMSSLRGAHRGGRGGGRFRHQGNTNRRQFNSSSLKCYACEELGHMANDCPKRSLIRSTIKKSNSSPQANVASGESGLQMGMTIIDSGASQHMFKDASRFHSMVTSSTKIACAGDQTLNSDAYGTVNMELGDGSESSSGMVLDNVLHVPDLRHNLLSVRALTKGGKDVVFKRDGAVELIGDDDVHEIGHAVGDHYQAYAAVAQETQGTDEATVWHHRLGHPGQRTLRMVPAHVVGLENKKLLLTKSVCEGCAVAKSHRLPFGKAMSRALAPLDRVHTDVCGPMPTTSYGGSRYIVTFIDDATRFAKAYYLKNKSETFGKFLEYKALQEKQTGRSLKTLRSDGGGEYINAEMHEYCQAQGIRHETTTADTPQQNGVAERFNRTLLEALRAMMHAAGVPEELWAELAATAVYLRNRLPTRVNRDEASPYELWHGRKPQIGHLRVIWADAFVHIMKAKRSKLGPRAQKLKLIGYHDDKKAYKLWNPTTMRIITSRDVIFDETVILSRTPMLPGIIANEEFAVEAIVGEKYVGGEKQYLVRWLGYSEEDDTWEPRAHVEETEALNQWENRQTALVTGVVDKGDPTTYSDAVSGMDAQLWKDAMLSELESIAENNTWSIVPRPLGRSLIGCKWVFKRKLNADGSVERYKARLVAKGFSQQYGIDYEETYAPVAKFTSIRVLLSIGAVLDLEMHQMDVKCAFLNGRLEEEIYMALPEGCDVPQGVVNPVCRLHKSLYGLKQSPRMWNKRIDEFLSSRGFTNLDTDHSIYVQGSKFTVAADFACIALYVDDLLLVAHHSEMLAIKAELSREFAMTDGGEVHHFLGLHINRNRSKRVVMVDQELFIEQILARFQMSQCKPVSTPLDVSVQLRRAVDGGENVSARPQVGAASGHFKNVSARPQVGAASGHFKNVSARPQVGAASGHFKGVSARPQVGAASGHLENVSAGSQMGTTARHLKNVSVGPLMGATGHLGVGAGPSSGAEAEHPCTRGTKNSARGTRRSASMDVGIGTNVQTTYSQARAVYGASSESTRAWAPRQGASSSTMGVWIPREANNMDICGEDNTDDNVNNVVAEPNGGAGEMRVWVPREADSMIDVSADINPGENKDGCNDRVDSTMYRSIIGSLMYLMTGTRPDIAAAVSIISQFSENPTKAHLQAAMRVLRYIKGSKGFRLHLGQDVRSFCDFEEAAPISLLAFSDANWGNDLDSRRSTTGYLVYIAGGVVSWSSKKQPTVALSSTEAEYMAVTNTTKEVMWHQAFLQELGFAQSQATTIFEDNQSCIALVKNPIHHARTKHIDIQHHFVREKVESNEVKIVYMPTETMVADALTKALAYPKFKKLVEEMGLRTRNL